MDIDEPTIVKSTGAADGSEVWDRMIRCATGVSIGIVSLEGIAHFMVKENGSGPDEDLWFRVLSGEFKQIPKPSIANSKYPQLRPTAQSTPEPDPPDSLGSG